MINHSTAELESSLWRTAVPCAIHIMQAFFTFYIASNKATEILRLITVTIDPVLELARCFLLWTA